MLLGGFWAPELRRALTSQSESLTSRPSKWASGSEKREAVTAGSCILLQVDGAAARLWHRKTRGTVAIATYSFPSTFQQGGHL